MLKVGCLIVFVVVIGIPVIASRYLSVWGTLGVVLLEGIFLLFVLPRLAKFAIKQFALRLFLTKSRVLKGAAVRVHEVRPTHRPVTRTYRESADGDGDGDEPDEAPALPVGGGAAEGGGDAPQVLTGDVIGAAPGEGEDAGDADEDADLRYVLIDFTLTPRAGASRMQFYDPAEILLVPIGAKVTFDEDPTDGGAGAMQVRLVDEAGAEHEVEDKITGAARLRAVFACPDDLRGRVKFRYYFEAFGDLALPEP